MVTDNRDTFLNADSKESLSSYKREQKDKTKAYLFFIEYYDLGIWGLGCASVLNFCLYNVLLLSKLKANFQKVHWK